MCRCMAHLELRGSLVVALHGTLIASVRAYIRPLPVELKTSSLSELREDPAAAAAQFDKAAPDAGNAMDTRDSLESSHQV